jgi:CDP-diacylglycerol--glycerol-3-phosphate 3-phosphatidyltransferase
VTSPPGAGAVPDPVAPPVTVPVQRASTWNVANALTAVRVLLVPIFGWLLLADGGQNPRLRALAALTFAVAAVTDRIDGELARRRDLVTDVGKIADPIADKALMGMALVGLSVLGELAWWITVVVLVREIGITLMRFLVIRHGVLPAGRGGKAKTALQAIAVTLYLLPLPAAWHPVEAAVMGLAVVVTVATGLDYVAKAWRLTRTSPRARARRAAKGGG